MKIYTHNEADVLFGEFLALPEEAQIRICWHVFCSDFGEHQFHLRHGDKEAQAWFMRVASMIQLPRCKGCHPMGVMFTDCPVHGIAEVKP